MICVLPALVAGSVLFRIRGGMAGDWGLPLGTLASRLVWANGMAVLAILLTGDFKLGLLAPALFLGCIFGFPACIDLGRNEGSFWRDFALLTLRGLWFTLPCAPVLWWAGHDWRFGLIGLSMAVLYEIGWRCPDFKYLRQTEKGEALFGALCGVSLCFV